MENYKPDMGKRSSLRLAIFFASVLIGFAVLGRLAISRFRSDISGVLQQGQVVYLVGDLLMKWASVENSAPSNWADFDAKCQREGVSASELCLIHNYVDIDFQCLGRWQGGEPTNGRDQYAITVKGRLNQPEVVLTVNERLREALKVSGTVSSEVNEISP